jgi:alpha-N-arabinofuranosidase
MIIVTAMKTKNFTVTWVLFILLVASFQSCKENENRVTIQVYPDSVLTDVSHHPVGINVNYFMDDDKYLKPARRIADALKAMGVKFLRYPGGNKSDLYLFSVPPYEKSQPTLARTGKGAVGYDRVVKNDKEYKFDVLDFDEFIALCREVGAEPIITVAADEYLVNYPKGCTVTNREGLLRNAVEWVRYSNIKKGYNVKYWLIGNECWHSNNENSTPEIYARDVVDFSKAMKAVDPSIYIIPNGNSVDFFKRVLAIAGNDIDLICLSNYPTYNYRAGYATYRDTLQNLLGPVERALTAMDELGKERGMRKFKMIVAEYGPFDWAYKWPFINDMGHALCNFEMAGEQLLTPEIAFSCFWNTRWIENDSVENSVHDALDKNGNFNATGYSIMIWGKYLGDNMVRITNTLHIRSFASYSPKENVLYVYLLNKAEESVPIKLEVENAAIAGIESYGQLTGKGSDDVDPVWNENVPITKKDLRNLTLPAVSISVLKLKLK